MTQTSVDEMFYVTDKTRRLPLQGRALSWAGFESSCQAERLINNHGKGRPRSL